MIGHTTFGLKRLTAELLATTLFGLTLIGPAAAEEPLFDVAPSDSPAIADQASNLPNLLSLLMTSDDRRQLAAKLAAAIRQGDMKAAENSLNTAIEVGTLAIVLADHVRDPSLLKTLQDLGIRGDAVSAPGVGERKAAVQNVCAAPAVANTANLADLQQALEQERSFNATVSQNLTGLMRKHDDLTARLEMQEKAQNASASEMQQVLQREKERAETAQRELERLQGEYRTLQAAREQDKSTSSSNGRDLEARLAEERERTDNTMRQLAGVQKELRDLQALRSNAAASEAVRVADLERALTRAQMRSDFLMRELTDTEEELRVLREPRLPGPAPVMFRLASTGAEPPLDRPEETAPLPKEPPAPVASAPPLRPEIRPAPQEVTSALPKEASSVMVASLPEGVQPLPLPATALPQPKAEPPAEAVRPEDRLMQRAEELLRKGDVSGARLLLERALQGGHARAAFLLAETFDPNVLSKLGVFGIRGDPAKARELYAQARALGSAQAGERLEALK